MINQSSLILCPVLTVLLHRKDGTASTLTPLPPWQVREYPKKNDSRSKDPKCSAQLAHLFTFDLEKIILPQCERKVAGKYNWKLSATN